jgi:hypothetical protein
MSKVGHNNPPPDQNGGWVAIRRAMREHWLVGFGQPVTPCDPDRGAYSRAEAFIDLIMECRYEAGTVNNGGRKMRIERGQLLGAVSWLANRWNWTPKTVRGFLDKLEGDAMIERFSPGTREELNGPELGKQKGKQASIITVCNYYAYQLVDYIKGQAPSQSEGTQRASGGQAEGNSTKDNKGTREQGNNTQAQSAPGVLVVNCETISHPNFVIDLQAVFQGAMLIGVPQDEAKAVAEIMAKDWIASNYKPAKPARYVIDELRKIANGKAIQGVRVDRASGKTPGKRMTLAELSDNVDAAYDRQFFGQPKTPRLTHER